MKRVAVAFFSYVLWRAWLLGIAVLASLFLPFLVAFTPQTSYGFFLPKLAWVWGNFDGVIFLRIADKGYGAAQVPFFPLYPAIIRLLHLIAPVPHLYLGLIVSTLAFCGGVFFSFRLLLLEKKNALFPLFFLVLLAFPTAYHYTAIYNDSLFFFLATATLFFTRSRTYWLAGIFGALATFCRLNGLALFFMMGAEYMSTGLTLEQSWEWKKWPQLFIRTLHPRRMWKSGVLFIVFIPLAFFMYLAFIEYRFGDWMLFFKGVEVWHRDKLVFPLQTFWRYMKIFALSSPNTFVYWTAVGEASFTALYGLVLYFSWKRIPLSYWMMMSFHWLIPVLTGTLQGMQRYGLHLFPLFFCLTMFLEKKPRWVQALYFAVMFLLQAVYVGFFTSGYFVS